MTLWKNLVVALVAAFALAACSSSDNGTDTSMPTDPPPTQAEQDLEALQDQIAALREQLGITDDDDPGDSIADLMDERDRLQGQLDDAADAADLAAKKAAAAEAGALFTGMDDTADDGSLTVVLAEISVSDSDDGGGSATISPENEGTDFLTGTGITVVQAVEATDTEVAMLGVWQGTELLGDTDGEMPSSTAVVYTDVGPDVGKAWAEVYSNVDATAVGNAGAGGSLLNTNPRAVISASAFSTAGLKDHHGDRNADSNVVSVSGTFDGAPGVYTCESTAAAACTSNLTTGGVVLGGTGGWSFNPVDNAQVSQPDTAYAYFGWWLHMDDNGPEADVFHGVTGLSAATAAAFTPLGGTATYRGKAAGKYAIDPVAPGTYASGGHWTADATLTANFEDPDAAVPAAEDGSISGMIENFVADGEDMDWSVSLGDTVLSNTATFNSGANSTDEDNSPVAGDDVVWTIADETAPESGSWSGALYDQTPPPDGNNVPSTATGEFSATYSEGGHTIGHMIGAFGAHVD